MHTCLEVMTKGELRTVSIAIEAILWQNLNEICDKKHELIFKCEMRSLQE